MTFPHRPLHTYGYDVAALFWPCSGTIRNLNYTIEGDFFCLYPTGVAASLIKNNDSLYLRISYYEFLYGVEIQSSSRCMMITRTPGFEFEDKCRHTLKSMGVSITALNSTIEYIINNLLNLKKKEELLEHSLGMALQVQVDREDISLTTPQQPFLGVVTDAVDCCYYNVKAEPRPITEGVHNHNNDNEINLNIFYFLKDSSGYETGQGSLRVSRDKIGNEGFYKIPENIQVPTAVKTATLECIIWEAGIMFEERHNSLRREFEVRTEINVIIADKEMTPEYESYWRNGEEPPTGLSRAPEVTSAGGVRPASEAAIKRLEKVVIADALSRECCVICSGEFSEEIMKMPCSHCYHEDCIVKWLRKNGVCPLCRFEV